MSCGLRNKNVRKLPKRIYQGGQSVVFKDSSGRVQEAEGKRAIRWAVWAFRTVDKM